MHLKYPIPLISLFVFFFLFVGEAPINLGLISNVLGPSGDPLVRYQCEGRRSELIKRGEKADCNCFMCVLVSGE